MVKLADSSAAVTRKAKQEGVKKVQATQVLRWQRKFIVIIRYLNKYTAFKVNYLLPINDV
jgi:hypothetical protein